MCWTIIHVFMLNYYFSSLFNLIDAINNLSHFINLYNAFLETKLNKDHTKRFISLINYCYAVA